MEESLTNLKPLHLPDPNHWWPPAPGWWLLLALGTLVLIWLVRYLRDKRQNTRYRKFALAELQQVKPDFSNTVDKVLFAQQLNELLKRTALAHYPRQAIASLSGKSWLAFLDQSSQSSEFSSGVGQVLADLPYRNHADAEIDCQALWELCQKWIQEHQ